MLDIDITHQLRFSNSLTYTYGQIVNNPGRYPLDHISPLFGRSSIDLQVKKFKSSFFLVFNGDKKSKDYNLSGEDNEFFSVDPINGFMPNWMTLNFNTTYSLNKKIQIQLSFDNILDTNYRQFASNISAGGRNISFTLRALFETKKIINIHVIQSAIWALSIYKFQLFMIRFHHIRNIESNQQIF